jgi:hypothetical protein
MKLPLNAPLTTIPILVGIQNKFSPANHLPPNIPNITSVIKPPATMPNCHINFIIFFVPSLIHTPNS